MIEEYTIKEIKEQIKDVVTWNDSDEKKMSLKALGSLLLSRTYQKRFQKGIFLEVDQLRLPSFMDRVFHITRLHTWLEYDDANVFDGTRRICLICGRTESSMMRRDLAYYERAGYEELDLNELLSYIKNGEVTTKHCQGEQE